jgi:hypothetical protein
MVLTELFRSTASQVTEPLVTSNHSMLEVQCPPQNAAEVLAAHTLCEVVFEGVTKLR